MSHPRTTRDPAPESTRGSTRETVRGLLATLLRVAFRLAHGVHLGLGLALLLGTGAMLLGAWAFVALADAVREGATQGFDEAVLRRLDAIHAPWLDTAMLEITALGNGTVVIALALIAGAFLWLTRHRYSAVLLAAATAGALLLSFVLKAYFDRPRPQVVSWGTHVATSSFPSGHATTAIVVYATVAFLITRLQRGRAARAVTTVLASVTILLIAGSRLFLGVHYPTDVAAGLAIGLAWAAFCMALLEATHRFIQREAPELADDELPPRAAPWR